MSEHEIIDWRKIAFDAGGYAPQALDFVREGLQHTVEMIHGNDQGPIDPEDDSRHVSGQQLCLGLRDLAIQRYGLLAPTVLSRWNIRRTDDFGQIVFALIDAGLLRKTDDDSMEDFEGVFEFDEAFAETETI